ncbi:crotonase/enoyl-CoA hydratase family protein [Variovorax rhizosphaerae]|uniref:Crotonase/enoyl-CoA hydratase family protein n=1 Tax=Variovorax rhizosphaerae TaxID=1836200 RepID=A0ABU8WNV5_9BURK
MSEPVLLHTEAHVLVVTINRPQVRNAINLAVAQGIAAAMDELDANPELHVGIITGAGGNFCAGMDLKAFAFEGIEPTIEGRGFAGMCETPPKKPLIAAVEGHAVAGGFEIVLSCDLVVASRAANFGLPEVKRGLVAAAGGLMRLPHRIPMSLAMEMALLGDSIPATQAQAWGLVNRLVEPGDALQEALALAARIDANAPLAVATSKQILRDSRTWTDDEMFGRQGGATRKIADSADAREGAAAFAQKRAAVWKGC